MSFRTEYEKALTKLNNDIEDAIDKVKKGYDWELKAIPFNLVLKALKNLQKNVKVLNEYITEFQGYTDSDSEMMFNEIEKACKIIVDLVPYYKE